MAHNLTESSTFTAAVEVPDDGDFVQEVSVEPGFQALANRTKFLNDKFPTSTDNAIARYDSTSGKLQNSGVLIEDDNDVTGVKDLTTTGDVTAGDDVVATGDFLYATPATRTAFIRLSSAMMPTAISADLTWRAAEFGATAYGNNATFAVDLPHLPVGSVITRIRMGVNPGAARAGTNRMRLSLFRAIPNTSTGAASGAQHGADANDDTTTNEQVVTLDLSGTPYTVIASEYTYVRVRAGNDAATNNDALNWIEVQYTDPGPMSPV